MSSSPNSLSSSDAALAAFGPMLDVACQVEVVLGTGVMSIRDCLHLQKNSIVRINRSAGSDLTITVNGVAIAHGEVVIIDDNAAIRLTDVLPPPGEQGVE